MIKKETIVGSAIFLGVFIGILAILLGSASSIFGNASLGKFLSLMLWLLPVILAAVIFFVDKDDNLRASLINTVIFLVVTYASRYVVLLIWKYLA